MEQETDKRGFEFWTAFILGAILFGFGLAFFSQNILVGILGTLLTMILAYDSFNIHKKYGVSLTYIFLLIICWIWITAFNF